jgi:hypothetical protein
MNSSNFCPLQSFPNSGTIKENYRAYTCNAGVTVRHSIESNTTTMNLCLQDQTSKDNSNNGNYLRYYCDNDNGKIYCKIYCASAQCVNNDTFNANIRRTDWLYKPKSGHDGSFVISKDKGRIKISNQNGDGTG